MDHIKYQYENKVIKLITMEMVGYQTKNPNPINLGKKKKLKD